MVLVFLLMFGLSTIKKEEEGILVNLGDSKIGWGKQEPKTSPAPAANPKPVKTPPSVSKPQKTEKTKEQIKTQDYDEAPEVKSEEQKRKEEEERKRKLEEARIQAEKERLRKIEEEKQRKLEEERKRKEEEERKKQEEAKAINNKVSSVFGKSTGSSTSEGDTKGSGNQGYVTGDPNSKNRSGSGQGKNGDGYQLAGRSLVGAFPKPQYDIQESGIVVVKIKVDRNGYVVGAEYQLKGSTTQNSQLVSAAIKAAKQAKFNKDPNAPAFVYGTITYHFELD
ncbi:MAG: TonB family protein [Chlorobi bacterium]|nr:TonB family protein [Chlorobiota bacterium]